MASDYDFGAAFARIENELIDSMMRNLRRNHLDWEDAEGFDWSQWQVEQLKYLEEYRKANEKSFGPRFARINSKLAQAIQHGYQNGQKSEEMSILQALAKNKQLQRYFNHQGIRGAGDAFFRINDRKLEALLQATQNDIQRAEYAVLRRSNDQYRKIIFQAQTYANTGAGTVEKAVDMATKDFLMRGIDCIEYKNGARHTISDYADMAIRTAERRAYLWGEGQKRQEWGVSLVIVNKRGGHPCPHCAKWVGKILIDDVYSGGRPDGKHTLLSEAMAQGFLHPRCKDGFTTYFPGVTSVPDPTTKAELREAEQAEQQETRQQHAELMAEKWDRRAKYSLDPDNKRAAEARAEEWHEEAAKSADLTERRRQRMAARNRAVASDVTEIAPAQPDFSTMNRSQLLQYAEDNLSTKFLDTKGANEGYLREAVRVLSEFEDKMGDQMIEGLHVRFGGLPPSSYGEYAKYDDKTKTVLLRKTGGLEQFEQGQRERNLKYRRKWNTDQDYSATETFSGTIWHELGHAVDIESGQALSRSLSANAVLDEASVRVSAYAGTTQNVRVTKRSEAWAENFAAYMDGGRNKSRVPPEIAEMIEGVFDQESIAKPVNSGIMNTKRIVNTKITPTGEVLNPMAKDDYLRMKNALNAQGVEVFAATQGDDLRYMLYLGAEGTYSNGRITHIGEIPSRGTFFEEIIHMHQSRVYGELSSTDPIELYAREIEANRKLLRCKGAYKLDDLDVSDIKRNLEEWERLFTNATGVSFDESNYRG